MRNRGDESATLFTSLNRSRVHCLAAGCRLPAACLSYDSPRMPRNQEVIRQWKVLHALESSRHGAAIDALARELAVTTRTIRRDLAALQEAGFPLYDERDDDGRVRWRLDGRALKGVETGFTLAELSALYFSRTLVEVLAATPFRQDVAAAFDKLAAVLTPQMRQFLDRLPLVFQAKGAAATTTVRRRAGSIESVRKPRADGQRNRERLMEAAKAAFAEVGADVSLEEIARRAGVGIGTLYRHFPTRDAIVEAVYRREVWQLASSAQRLLGEVRPGDALHQLMRLCQAVIGLIAVGEQCRPRAHALV